MEDIKSSNLMARDMISEVNKISTTSSPPGDPANIQNIPYEILVQILNYLNPVTITCLGLASTTLYTLTQPHLLDLKPSLDDCSCGSFAIRLTHDGHLKLADLIANWIGPSYRYHQWTYHPPYLARPSFFKRSIYDDPEAFQAVLDRWEDRLESNDRDTLGKRFSTGRYEYRLPSPFGMGEGWYEVAREAMKVDFKRERSLKAWLWYWNRFHIFKYGEGCEKMVDDFLWEMWGEGLKLLSVGDDN